MSLPYVENHDIADPYREDINVNKVVNNTAGSILGYKYFNFDGFEGCESVSLVLDMIPESVGGKIAVYTSAPWKGDAMPVGEYSLPSGVRMQARLKKWSFLFIILKS